MAVSVDTYHLRHYLPIRTDALPFKFEFPAACCGKEQIQLIGAVGIEILARRRFIGPPEADKPQEGG